MSSEFVVPKAPEGGLNPKFIQGLKPRPGGGIYEVADVGKYRGLRVRVSAKGKVFYASARWKKGATSATSRAIGPILPLDVEAEREGYVTLKQARTQFDAWKELADSGIDPAEREREELEAEERAKKEADTIRRAREAGRFSAVVEAFLDRDEFRRQRRSAKVENEIRNELLNPDRNSWMDKHISEIDDEDVLVVIEAIRDRKRELKDGTVIAGAPYQAIIVLQHLKAIFTWAMRPGRRKSYGMQYHPIAHLRPRDFGLKKEARQTLLKGDEIRAFWRAADRMGHPYGDVFKLLLVTGQRRSEIANALWSEIDLAEKVLVVPPERFKSNASHIVPLSDLALELLAGVRRFDGRGLVFSKTGKRRLNGFGPAKTRLDRYMGEELRKLAEERGDDPSLVEAKDFVTHDLRRVVRSQLSSLRVPETVAEMIVGHGKKGLARVYNQHEYLDEMREGLQLWADRLRIILNPPSGSNVVMMKRVS